MSAPSIKSITETPLPNDVNPFDWLPTELDREILDKIDDERSRLSCEKAWVRFYSFSAKPLEAGLKWIAQPPSQDEINLRNVYESFKERMKQLNIEFPSDYFMHKVVKFTDNLFKVRTPADQAELVGQVLQARVIEPMIQRFHGVVFYDLINTYADQYIVKMTLKNFMGRISFIHDFYRIPIATIEAIMRRAIKRNDRGLEEQAQRTAEIEAARQNCLKPKGDLPLFINEREFKAYLYEQTTVFEEEKRCLEEEVFRLRGPTGFDGEINAAFQAGDLDRYNRLVGSLSQKAQYDGLGRLVGGRLLDIDHHLSRSYALYRALDDGYYNSARRTRSYRTEAIERLIQENLIPVKKIKFLEELNQEVVEGAEEARSQALHAIFNGDPLELSIWDPQGFQYNT